MLISVLFVMNKVLLFIILCLLCLSSVSASVVTRYGSDFKIVGDEISFKVSDRLGSDRLILDDNSIIAESNNLPYGQQLKNNNVKFGFTGKELDDTNNYYFNARYYDYDSGKFLGVDPVSDNHAYAYVSNNPMNMVDPSGMADFFAAESTRVNFNSFGMTKNGPGSDEYWSAVLTEYINSEWHGMIRDDISEINSVSESTGVPAEAMLSAILVEDIRFYARRTADVLTKSYLKGLARMAAPNFVLGWAGHQPNPKAGQSHNGFIGDYPLIGAVQYLRTVDGLDEGTKNLLSKAPSVDSFSDFNSLSRAFRKSFSHVERVALALKAHMVFWEQKGYDLFESDFKTIDSFGERVGVLETLNVIFSYNYADEIDIETKELIPKGFTSFFGQSAKQEGYITPKNYCVPHDSPHMGGTVLWDSVTYGEISSIFVDSGLARQIMESGE